MEPSAALLHDRTVHWDRSESGFTTNTRLPSHTNATNKLDVLEAHVIEHRDLLTYVFERPTLFHQVSE